MANILNVCHHLHVLMYVYACTCICTCMYIHVYAAYSASLCAVAVHSLCRADARTGLHEAARDEEQRDGRDSKARSGLPLDLLYFFH